MIRGWNVSGCFQSSYCPLWVLWNPCDPEAENVSPSGRPSETPRMLRVVDRIQLQRKPLLHPGAGNQSPNKSKGYFARKFVIFRDYMSLRAYRRLALGKPCVSAAPYHTQTENRHEDLTAERPKLTNQDFSNSDLSQPVVPTWGSTLSPALIGQRCDLTCSPFWMRSDIQQCVQQLVQNKGNNLYALNT